MAVPDTLRYTTIAPGGQQGNPGHSSATKERNAS
jgi:hypothetical protein